jgi:hypothetical protein
MTTVNQEAPEQSDTDIIAAYPNRVHLSGADLDVDVERLRTRQLFKFLRILTVGAGPALAELEISSDTDQAELTQQLMAILLISIPEAEDEVIDFLRSMVKPINLVEPERSKADREANVEKYTTLYTQLNNPAPEDTLELLIRIVKNEAPNMIALGKQIAALLPSAAKLTNSTKKPSKKSTPAAS